MVNLEKNDKDSHDIERKPQSPEKVLGFLRSIYEGIRNKLLKIVQLKDVSQEEVVDEKSQKDFLGFSVRDVEEKYMRVDGFRKIKKVNIRGLMGDLEKKLQDYLDSVGEISDDFFEEIYRLSKEYKNLNVGHDEQFNSAEAGLKFAELSVLIKNPKLIKDERIVKILEFISDLRNAVPWGFQMFSTLEENNERVLLLSDGIAMDDHLPAFEKIIMNEKLWKNEFGFNRAEMRKKFLSSIAEAIELMTREDSSKTLLTRLRILKICADYPMDTESAVRNLFFTFFKEKEEIQILKSFAGQYLEISPQRAFFDDLINHLEEDNL